MEIVSPIVKTTIRKERHSDNCSKYRSNIIGLGYLKKKFRLRISKLRTKNDSIAPSYIIVKNGNK